MHWVALVILVVLVLVYVLIGGAVFMELEKDNETNMTEDTHVAFKSFIGNVQYKILVSPAPFSQIKSVLTKKDLYNALGNALSK